MRRRHHGSIEPGNRPLSRDDSAARAFTAGLRARCQHSERHATQAADTQHNGVRIESRSDIELRPHRPQLQRVVIDRGLDTDFLDPQPAETAEQAGSDRPSCGFDDLSARGSTDTVTDCRDLAVLDEQVGMLQGPR